MGRTHRVMAVDGSNVLIRSMKAMERAGLSTADGIPTGGVMTFVNSLARHVAEEQPERLVVCWDGGKSAHRVAIYPDYKERRSGRSDDTHSAFAIAKEFLTLAGVHHVEVEGVEADDLIAHYWRTKGNDDRLIILSGDKDFFQLLDGWTEQVRPGTGPTDRWTSNRVRTEWGCKPEHIPYVMALTGDSGDDVPGVHGIGRKTACKLLGKHQWSLDGLLSEAASIPRLAGAEGNVRRNLKLVDLRSPFPGLELAQQPPRFEPTTRESVLWGPLIEFLDRYEFAVIRTRLEAGVLWEDASDGPPAVNRLTKVKWDQLTFDGEVAG